MLFPLISFLTNWTSCFSVADKIQVPLQIVPSEQINTGFKDNRKETSRAAVVVVQLPVKSGRALLTQQVRKSQVD